MHLSLHARRSPVHGISAVSRRDLRPMCAKAGGRRSQRHRHEREDGEAQHIGERKPQESKRVAAKGRLDPGHHERWKESAKPPAAPTTPVTAPTCWGNSLPTILNTAPVPSPRHTARDRDAIVSGTISA